MANSFSDQFLKAGLVNKTQASKAEKTRHRQTQQKRKQKVEVVNEAAEVARRAAAEKAAHDRELNRQQKEAAEKRAVQAQIRQLVEMNRLSREGGELAYHFQHGTAIRSLHVSAEMHARLGRGLLAIVSLDDHYEVIPAVVADKIRLRDADCIISNEESRLEAGEDDPYADYQVPDDLMW